jgi:hypothetical protein
VLRTKDLGYKLVPKSKKASGRLALSGWNRIDIPKLLYTESNHLSRTKMGNVEVVGSDSDKPIQLGLVERRGSVLQTWRSAVPDVDSVHGVH